MGFNIFRTLYMIGFIIYGLTMNKQSHEGKLKAEGNG